MVFLGLVSSVLILETCFSIGSETSFSSFAASNEISFKPLKSDSQTQYLPLLIILITQDQSVLNRLGAPFLSFCDCCLRV